MTNQSVTVSQAAQQLGVSPSTVRRLCGEYADQLSLGASPSAGTYRRLSRADVQTLSEVIRMRNEGMGADAIRAQLSSMVFAPALSEQTQDSPRAPKTALAIVDALQSIVAPLAARVDALEAQRQRVDVIFVALAAFIAGLIVGLAVWWFQ